MATNKHAIIRYQTLDKCFRNTGRKYFIDNLIDECNNAIHDFTGNFNGVKRRQIYDDIIFMESEQGWSVPLKRFKEGRKVYLRYSDTSFSINNSPLNLAEEHQLKEALLTLSRLKGIPQFTWVEEITTRINSGLDSTNQSSKVIEFDQNQYLKGIEFINPLYQAIITQKTISVEYQSFKQLTVQNIIIHPYFLKQYNNRWFIFGLNNDYKNISNLALDRIVSLEQTDTAFEKQESIDFEEFFDDMIGVTVPEGEKPQNILLKITASLWPYIKTKPLHGSQKIKEVNELHTLVELNLIINYELISLLFSYADNITVLEPIILKDQIKAKAYNLIKNYL
ncbi:MAG: WYL domain-containing protein [Sphingobacteriales bacterium]|nr:MAG: WYL domain-containing protein [Sphingobacteriales bacterium]